MKKGTLKNVATAQWDFSQLRADGNYVYVDKTDMLARLASRDRDALYFISRPRRFGKSLMLSTLKCMFEGRRELFRGLKIMKTGWDWKKQYPVVMLNMQEFKASNPEDVESSLYGAVKSLAEKYGLKLQWDRLKNSGQAFTECLRALGEKKGRYVVLVDEYDVPLQGFLGSPEIGRIREMLHDFYSAFKSNAASIRFLMMTGVSKFTKLSVFSSLNNLTDLSAKYGEYAALLGYTHEELKAYFGGHISALAEKLGRTPDEAYRSILSWYDSYRFSPYSDVRVVNPVALGESFNAGVLSSFWSATGMPTLILERLQASAVRPDQLDGVSATLEDLDVCDANDLPWLPLLYQAGYLTIKSVEWMKSPECAEASQPVMTLGIPNEEVRYALSGQWWKTLMRMEERDFKALVHVAEKHIASGDINGLLDALYGLYAKLPPNWSPKNEAEAKRYFLLFMEMSGARMHPEKPSCRGFADAVIEMPKGVWIFEFKFNRSAASAIRQIRDRGYAEPYRTEARRSRPITLVGIKFDSKTRNIDIPRIENL